MSPPSKPQSLQVRAPWLHPTRWLIMAGTAVLFVTAWLPWQSQWFPYSKTPDIVTGMNTWDAPGAQLMIAAVVTLLLSLSRGIAGSRIEVLHWLPGIAGVATLFIAVEAYQVLAPNPANGAQSMIIIVEPGMWLTLLGALMVALGSGLATWLMVRDDRRRRGPRPKPVDPLARYQRPQD